MAGRSESVSVRPGSATPVLEMLAITKRFPGCTALDGVNFSVDRGEVHALVGENGAGKSTLAKVMTGLPRDGGEVRVSGKPASIASYRDAQRYGIALVPQELALAPALSVAENVLMGRLPCSRPRCLVSFRDLNRKAGDLTSELGLGYDVRTQTGSLSLANQQLVTIAKALAADPRIIIMDEPTSALTRQEKERLFGVIRSLRAKGISIVYISHFLDEVFRISDRITVLRDGHYVGTVRTAETDEATVIRMMVGRQLGTLYPKEPVPIGGPVLEVAGLGVEGRLRDVSFTLHRGEIIGVAGLLGSGRSELLRAIFGADPKVTGKVLIDGSPVDVRSPKDAILAGVGLVPEDRKQQGLHLRMNIRENICMVRQFREAIGRFGLANVRVEEATSRECAGKLDIRMSSLSQLADSLSGGNQQKVVLGKWLTTKPKVLLLDEPTRGIDVGAKAAIHALMVRLAAQGIGILMASSELPEVIGMSDRIMVLARGRCVGIVERSEATQERLMALMTRGETSDARR